ncbi:MAG: thiamine phosphate synthase [Bacteroidia bacterium]
MISKFQYITQEVEGKTHAQLAEEACIAGVDWIQLRVKNRSAEEWRKIAIETLSVCKKRNAKLIVNDNVLLAKEIVADGVHLGKDDMSSLDARKILGDKFMIGGTANTFEDIKKHVAAGVDYVGVGPFRFTTTKDKLSPILGLDGYKTIIEKCKADDISVPVIAIGGIMAEDVSEIIESGVYGVAVAGAITFANDKEQMVKEFLNRLNGNLESVR